MNRRAFLQATAMAGAAAALAACGHERTPEVIDTAPASILPSPTSEPAPLPTPSPTPAPERSTVYLIRTDDRVAGTRQAFEMLSPDLAGKQVFIKPNFNSADPPPGSTDPGMLAEAIRYARDSGAAQVRMGDRSGMGVTSRVMDALGITALADELDAELMDFSRFPAESWELMRPDEGHWPDGFAVAKPVLDADAVINLCCLKTHRYGGHFTLSLKNSVGMIADRVPGLPTEFMQQLHASSHQRRMIAEINLAYEPAAIVMDGVDAFVQGGPATGTRVHPGVVLAGTDRVAVDAVGVALLRIHGTTPEVSRGSIFEQEQIARAVELGLGVPGPERIDLEGDTALAARIMDELFN